jgi:two-component system, chemotaxis family, protein-glutamate methylesterase/glutaminase
VVAVVASAGGVEALSTFVGKLPAEFRAAVLVVLHIPPAGPSLLPQILARAGKLPCRHPEDGERLQGGVVLVAPPGRHLTVAGGHVRLLAGARQNGHRPSADALLRSVAETFGNRAAGVVLSGTMDDGAAGLRAVRAVEGFTLVQDPEEAAFPAMPLAAIHEADPHVVGPVTALADRVCDWLARLADDPQKAQVSDRDPANAGLGDPGVLTPLTCPECGGTLWLQDDYGSQRFHCRVGHKFSAEGLLLGKQQALEAALWAAVVALDERVDLSRRIVRRLEGSGRPSQLRRHEQDIAAAQHQAAFLRGLLNDLIQSESESHDGDKASGADSAS